MKIDLKDYQSKNSKVFSGRESGKNVRKKINLDRIEDSYQTIDIEVPIDTFSINASFFLGLFGPSVRKYGKRGFKEKYKFLCDDIIMESIEDGIERALKTSDVLV